MKPEQVITVTWVQHHNQYWVETQGKTQRLHRIPDRSDLQFSAEISIDFNILNQVSTFLVNS